MPEGQLIVNMDVRTQTEKQKSVKINIQNNCN